MQLGLNADDLVTKKEMNRWVSLALFNTYLLECVC